MPRPEINVIIVPFPDPPAPELTAETPPDDVPEPIGAPLDGPEVAHGGADLSTNPADLDAAADELADDTDVDVADIDVTDTGVTDTDVTDTDVTASDVSETDTETAVDPEVDTEVAVEGEQFEDVPVRAATPAVEALLAPKPAVAAKTPVVEGDAHGWRTTGIGSRIGLVAVTGLVTSGIVVVGFVATLSSLEREHQNVTDLARARNLNTSALGDLRVLEVAPDDGVPEIAVRLSAASAGIDILVGEDDMLVDIEEAADASEEYVEARVDDAGAAVERSLLDTAIEDRGAVDDELETRLAAANDDFDRLQRRLVTAALIVMAVGTLMLLWLWRSITSSITRPLRLVGRNMRRFGDGDHAARAAVAGDEVGTLARSFNSMADSVSIRINELTEDAERGTQLRMVSEALDLADRETDVYRIVERALGLITPTNPGELLVTEPTSSRLWQVSANPEAGPANCPVETSEGCIAMRRAQTMVFDSPSSINSCPQLRNRESACSATCVPVSVNGHLLGVVHMTAPEFDPPDPGVVDQVVTLGGQIGVRVGAIRTLETTRLQASTDGLTGLANRRMLEARIGDFIRGGVPFALAVADLDRFKQLNDTYGHETGDRALQLFAKVLQENVRGHDVVARFGGEEFVLVYPELLVKPAMEVIERIRHATARAVEAAGLPPFTCSFGVTHSSDGTTVESIIRIADAGLLMAKDLGRDRAVYADQELAAEVFGSGRRIDRHSEPVVDLTDAAVLPESTSSSLGSPPQQM